MINMIKDLFFDPRFAVIFFWALGFIVGYSVNVWRTSNRRADLKVILADQDGNVVQGGHTVKIIINDYGLPDEENDSN